MLGPAAATAADGSGRSLDYAGAVRMAREWAPDPPQVAKGELRPLALTRRELEIAVMVAQGMSNRQMAQRLVITVRTVEGHVENIRSKLGFHSRTQIAGWAIERELIARTPKLS